jgi:hypothetical protein
MSWILRTSWDLFDFQQDFSHAKLIKILFFDGKSPYLIFFYKIDSYGLLTNSFPIFHSPTPTQKLRWWRKILISFYGAQLIIKIILRWFTITTNLMVFSWGGIAIKLSEFLEYFKISFIVFKVRNTCTLHHFEFDVAKAKERFL